jgi:hypothetical protein
MFKSSPYRKYHWDWVGQILEKRFPDALPEDPKGKRDLAEWAKDLAKRHRKLQKNFARLEIAQFRDSRLGLRRKLNTNPPAKTLATICPYLLKTEGAKFWPHELPSHDPKSCSMCNDRAKRARMKTERDALEMLELKRMEPEIANGIPLTKRKSGIGKRRQKRSRSRAVVHR